MDKSTVIRVVVFLLAWLNQILASKGMHTLPVLSEEVVAELFAFVISIYTLWKNNYLTKKGQSQKEAIEKAGVK